jgi:hypothetical protein
MSTFDRSEILGERLLAAGRQELSDLLEENATVLGVEDALMALHNPFLDTDGVGTLLEQERLLGSYRLRRELATHRLTPEARALQLVATLFWRDLVDVQRDARVSPRLRRAAEKHLAARLPGLSQGEKIAMARRASGPLIEELGAERHARVVAALLENPRCTEGMVTRIAGRPGAAPEVLEVVARARRWSSRVEVRRALCLNPAAPVGVVLPLLPSLAKGDLRRVARLPSLAATVRRRAGVLLGEEPR